MATKPTPDETPKATVARKVVAQKRRYFTPAGHSVEAKNLEDAVKQVHKLTNTGKEGDGK